MCEITNGKLLVVVEKPERKPEPAKPTPGPATEGAEGAEEAEVTA